MVQKPPQTGGFAWDIPPDQNGLKIRGGLLGFFVCWKQRTYILSNGTPTSIISIICKETSKWEELSLINTNYTCMHGVFLCINFNSRTHVQFLPSEFISTWSKYLKCWVYLLVRDFPRENCSLMCSILSRVSNRFCPFQGHYCWLSSRWVGVPFHHRNYDCYCTLIGFQPSKQPVVARNFHQLVLFTLRKTRNSFWEPPLKWYKDDFCCWR